MPNLYLPVSASVISSIILTIYCTKRKMKIRENTLYFIMLIAILCDSLIVSAIFLNLYLDYKPNVVRLLNRFDFTALFCWSTCLFLYTYSVIHKEDDNFSFKFRHAKEVCISVGVVLDIIMWFLDIDLIYIDNLNATAGGPAVIFSIVGCLAFFLGSFVVVLASPKASREHAHRQIIPVYVSLLITVIIALLFTINPYLICISMGLTIVNLVMYFTIENPDLQMLETVQLAKDEAQKANQAKTDFLSSMSHEIRTPLNAILGLSEYILEEEDTTNVKEYAKDIVSASHILLELVNGILDISKIEAGMMEIVEKEYDLTELATNVAKLVRTRIGEKPLILNVTLADDIPGVLYGDGAKVRQVITNLLTNAVKYTDKGTVDLLIACVNKDGQSELAIKVADTGRGIKKEDLEHLFDKFKRLDVDKNYKIEGTGLGMSITHSIVELLGGRIEVASTYGEGSEFSVYLTQPIRSMERKKNVETAVDASSFKGKRVLIVDDSELNIKVESLLLRQYRMVVDYAYSGGEAVGKCLTKNYDLVFMDDMMPDMDGTTTMRVLRDDYGYTVPIVILTANAIEGMRDEYIKSGFDDYLAKPMDKKELIRVLKRFLVDKAEKTEYVNEKLSV